MKTSAISGGEVHFAEHRIESWLAADRIESWIDLHTHDSAIADRQCVVEFVQSAFPFAELRVDSRILIAAVLASDPLQLGENLHGGGTIAGAGERQRFTVELLPGTGVEEAISAPCFLEFPQH